MVKKIQIKEWHIIAFVALLLLLAFNEAKSGQMGRQEMIEGVDTTVLLILCIVVLVIMIITSGGPGMFIIFAISGVIAEAFVTFIFPLSGTLGVVVLIVLSIILSVIFKSLFSGMK